MELWRTTKGGDLLPDARIAQNATAMEGMRCAA
jgi:hypothetical protein